MTVVTIYGKSACSLCDEALVELERLAGELGFRIEQRDIDSDERWLRTYFERIPVIAVDGEELCDYFVDERLLRAHLSSRADDLESRP